MEQIDYSAKLKDVLENLVPNKKKKRSLSVKIENKVNEMKLNLNSEKEEIIYFALNNSQYFLKDNGFKKESFFSLIDKDIFKLFYELLLNPTYDQLDIFFKDFEELEYGAGNIFLISCKICEYFGVGPLDLFFTIIFKENMNNLKELMKRLFNLDLIIRHEILLKYLYSYTKIKNNYNINSEEVLNYFLYAFTQSGDKNLKIKEMEVKKVKGNFDKDELNNPMEKKNKAMENIDNENNQSNITTDIEKDENKFLNHLKKMQLFYETLNYETPVLNYLIEKKGKIQLNYFKYSKNDESFVDHIYENLNSLIANITINFNKEKYGYFCYKNPVNNNFVESLYSIIELKLLFDKINSDKNFPKDNFKNPDTNIARNAFKSRALSFEYYINNNILLQKYKVKERPRVLYPFKSLREITNNLSSTKDNDLVEVDGVILEKTEIKLDLEKNNFIVDKLYKCDKFDLKTEQDIEAYKEEYINLNKNTLCIIEIKNQFPDKERKEEKDIDQKNKPISFYQMVKNLIKKAKIFKQYYEQEKEEIEHIRLLLFYNVIQKENYYEELNKAINDSSNLLKEDDLYKILEFQCIYIKSSYLAGESYNSNIIISQLVEENKKINEKFNKIEEENKSFKRKIKNKLYKIKKILEELLEEEDSEGDDKKEGDKKEDDKKEDDKKEDDKKD